MMISQMERRKIRADDFMLAYSVGIREFILPPVTRNSIIKLISNYYFHAVFDYMHNYGVKYERALMRLIKLKKYAHIKYGGFEIFRSAQGIGYDKLLGYLANQPDQEIDMRVMNKHGSKELLIYMFDTFPELAKRAIKVAHNYSKIGECVPYIDIQSNKEYIRNRETWNKGLYYDAFYRGCSPLMHVRGIRPMTKTILRDELIALGYRGYKHLNRDINFLIAILDYAKNMGPTTRSDEELNSKLNDIRTKPFEKLKMDCSVVRDVLEAAVLRELAVNLEARTKLQSAPIAASTSEPAARSDALVTKKFANVLSYFNHKFKTDVEYTARFNGMKARDAYKTLTDADKDALREEMKIANA